MIYFHRRSLTVVSSELGRRPPECKYLRVQSVSERGNTVRDGHMTYSGNVFACSVATRSASEFRVRVFERIQKTVDPTPAERIRQERNFPLPLSNRLGKIVRFYIYIRFNIGIRFYIYIRFYICIRFYIYIRFTNTRFNGETRSISACPVGDCFSDARINRWAH